jgi:hypothetical protein
MQYCVGFEVYSKSIPPTPLKKATVYTHLKKIPNF